MSSPILKAVELGHVDRASALIDAGASIDASLLALARQLNHETLVEFLEQSLQALSMYDLLKM